MNTLVIGRHSSGKTNRIIIKEIDQKINNDESFLFLDTKEEYYKHYQNKLKGQGYEINIINLRKVLQSNSWNPLSLPYSLYKNNEDKAIELLKNIGYYVFDNETVRDKFLVNASADLFVGLSLVLFEFSKIEAINLFSINNMLENKEVVKQLLDKFDPTSPIYLSLSEILLLPKETMESIFSIFRQNLNVYLLYENLSTLLSYTEFNLNGISDKKTALFIVNKDENRGINKLVNIYINQVYQIIVNANSNHKFNFVLDNIETIDKLYELHDMLSVSNSRNFDVIIGCRDLDWYKNKYEFLNIDVLYNLSDRESVIKVMPKEKRKYSIKEYPVIELRKDAKYPLLKARPKYLFNLVNFMQKNKL